MVQLPTNTLLQGGKYRIEKVLGQGGFGITYLGTQVGLNRKVAIKEFFRKEYCERDGSTSRVSLGTSGNREDVERFRQKFIKEANIISQLNHPHIIKIFEIFQENNTAYYVMEYWDNGSLEDYVRNRGKLDEAEALGYISQVAEALSYLHKRKINHLDVKPGNLLLDRDMNILLIDFGTSKRYNKEEKETSSTPVPHSAGYAPLELYQENGVSTFSPTTDIYSLGATLYKMLTGKRPPEASYLIDEDLPPFPARVSKATASAINAAMQPSKKKRPQSVEEFMALLSGKKEKTTIIKKETDLKSKTVSTPNPQPKHYDHKGKEQSYTETAKWYRKAAEQGDASAQYNLGCCYDEGQGVKQSYTEAVKWFRKAAEQGDARGQYNLGCYYYKGQGVELSYTEAVKWFRKAAEQGDARGQYNLGCCYHKGRGVEHSYTEAVKWYRRAAEQGDASAQYNLGCCYDEGQGVKQSYTEAIKWYHKAAEQRNAGAQYNLGCHYYKGQGVELSYTEAVKWFRKAAEQRNADAQYNLGYCYHKGRGVEQSYTEAVKWFRKAAEQGNEYAKKKLKELEENNEVTVVDARQDIRPIVNKEKEKNDYNSQTNRTRHGQLPYSDNVQEGTILSQGMKDEEKGKSKFTKQQKRGCIGLSFILFIFIGLFPLITPWLAIKSTSIFTLWWILTIVGCIFYIIYLKISKDDVDS